MQIVLLRKRRDLNQSSCGVSRIESSKPHDPTPPLYVVHTESNDSAAYRVGARKLKGHTINKQMVNGCKAQKKAKNVEHKENTEAA